MKIDEFLKKVSGNQREIQRLMNTVLPVKIGNMAKKSLSAKFCQVWICQ